MRQTLTTGRIARPKVAIVVERGAVILKRFATTALATAEPADHGRETGTHRVVGKPRTENDALTVQTEVVSSALGVGLAKVETHAADALRYPVTAELSLRCWATTVVLIHQTETFPFKAVVALGTGVVVVTRRERRHLNAY